MQFSKMHGLGNDFVIIDGINQNVFLTSQEIVFLSNRNIGIGFDQLIIVEVSHNYEIDFYYRIFNSNGFEAFQCGNGVRCLAKFVYLKKLTKKKIIKVTTKFNTIKLYITKKNDICANMGFPIFLEKHFFDDTFIKSKKIFFLDLVSIGNFHCVFQVDNVENIKMKNLILNFKKNKLLKNMNFSFMEIINYKYIRLRVYENGVGETQSCGTAACAAVIVGIKHRLLSNNVEVKFFQGSLYVSWEGKKNPIYLRGSATHVFDGNINI
ncbi:MAG: diaminopimelate epimerase [Arsenophonus sp.]|nr:MAG: diaminopimelate epimerase [Arsenophonus sp.]